ncbi:MAG TPA: hypothetical protein VHP11_09885 [Tepidisphaeraceae bacterium]|nr:hypothetical protein [Tepidisphaeraceae bacterium]
MKVLGDREDAPNQPHHDVLVRIGVLGLHEQHLDAGDDQKTAENIQNPVIARNQPRAQRDHHATHDQRAQNAPKQHPVLVDRRHREEREEHGDDKDVVHAQGFLHDVAGQVFDRRGAAVVDRTIHDIHMRPEPQPVVFIAEVDEDGERQSQGDPRRRPPQGFLYADDMGLAMKDAQVQRQHSQHKQDKPQPDPDHDCSRLRSTASNYATGSSSHANPAKPLEIGVKS